jgi:uncharacterized protein (TIGR00369 family)
MTGTDVMRQFLPSSPFAADLGLRLEDIADDEATLVLPYAARLATTGDIVHGGAIATLADCAVMAAAWAGAEVPESMRGVTVSLTLEYLDPARGEDLRAHGRVIRRGRSLCACEVDVCAPDGRLVAKGLATYKLG